MDLVDEILDCIDVMTAGDREYYDMQLFDGFDVEEDDFEAKTEHAVMYVGEWYPFSQMRIDNQSIVWIPNWLWKEKHL